MKLVKQLKAGRLVNKLKSSRTMTTDALQSVQDELFAMSSAALSPLLECLSHGDARTPAIEVLVRLADDKHLGQFTEALASPNPAIVSGVTQVLAKAKTYDPTQLLELISDPSLPKTSLESILWEQIEKIPPRTVIAMVPEMAKEARAVIFRLLEKVADQTIVADVIQLSRHSDWWIRLYAAKLLGNYAGKEGVESLVTLLKDDNKSVRLEAVGSLHRIKESESVPALVQNLRDADLKVQSAAIDALIDFAGEAAVPHLLDVLKDESEHARRAAVEVLNEVATPKAIQDLVSALRDADWWVRVRAADALGSLGGPKVVEATLSLLGEEDDFLRRYAVEILNAIPSEHSVDRLIIALNDNDWWVRERAIDALAKTGDTRAVPPIIELLESKSTAAPLCARALGELADPRAVDPLCEASVSGNEELRRESVSALNAIAKTKIPADIREKIGSALAKTNMQIETSRADAPLRMGDRHSPFGPEAARSDSPSPSSADSGASGGSPPPSEQPGIVSPSIKEPSATVNFHDLAKDTLLLDRYRVIRKVGKGGFGAVYLVEDSAVEEQMIIKVLNPQMSSDESSLRRFVQELRLTRKITHHNVIRIYDLLDLGGAHGVSMEYFPGMDLAKILKTEKKLAPKRALQLCGQICEGLIAAHEENIIHRDIKPANILVNEDDIVKIVDFGLASAGQHVGSRLTKSGLLIGTPEYMAPEQISGDEVDHRADLYGVGVMLYEMLSGVKPFTSDTPVKILFLHLEGEVTPLGELVDGISLDIEYLVGSAMARNAADRPDTAQALLEMVNRTLSELDAAA